MITHFTHQLNQLRAALSEICAENTTMLQQSEKALMCLEKYDRDFKARVREGALEDMQEEIRYFRCIRPELLSGIIFYTKVYHIELRKPGGAAKSIRKYYRGYLEDIEDFYLCNAEFIQYMRSGSSQLDAFYFVRSNISYKTSSDSSFSSLDEEQTTDYDIRAAKLIAYDRLDAYLNKQIRELKEREQQELQKPENLLSEKQSSAIALDDSNNRLLLSAQVERMLKMAPNTLLRLRKSGKLPYVKVGGKIYYQESDIREFLNRNKWKNID